MAHFPAILVYAQVVVSGAEQFSIFLVLPLDATQHMGGVGWVGGCLRSLHDAPPVAGLGGGRMITFLARAHMLDATQGGMLTFFALAHMLDATQLVWGGGDVYIPCICTHVDMLQAASRWAAIGRHFSLCLPWDLHLHPSWRSFQSSLRNVLCCAASQTKVASAVLRLRLARTPRKPASSDPWERRHPSQYQHKQTQGLEDLQDGLSRAKRRIYAAQRWSCSCAHHPAWTYGWPPSVSILSNESSMP